MPNTPVYALPYPALSDTPNGPAQIGALATATETAIGGVSTTVATNTKTYPRLFTGRLASNQGITGTADLTGCTVTFTTAQANTLVQITMNAVSSNTPTNYMVSTCVIDGTSQTEQLFSSENSVISQSPSASITLIKTLASAGSHTIKMQATQSGGTTNAIAPHTGISVLVIGP